MNQKQIAIREFFEQVLLERMDYDRFENLREYIRNQIFNENEDGETVFC